MIWAVRQLCSPLRYLRIEQGSGLFTSKLTYDAIIPAILSAVSTAATYRLGASIGLFASTGLVPGVLDLLNLMIAFFIAALAAVATFDKPSLDEPMKGDPAVLRLTSSNGSKKYHKLTNRQFICYVFGYLSFASIMLIAVLYITRQIGPSILARYHFELWAVVSGKLVGTFALFLAIWQIFITTLLGIYFLCDRLQFIDDPEL
jgi:hypothetical protein